jgi:mannose-6-phosphate isomerase
MLTWTGSCLIFVAATVTRLDILECMATSDNVVRAGLTPKLRDVSTLISMLTYNASPPDAQLLKPSTFRSTSHSTLYNPDIAEFSVLRTHLPSAGDKESPIGVEGPSILIVVRGQGSIAWGGEKAEKGELKEGGVWFVKSGQQVGLEAGEGSKEGLEVYRAFVEVDEEADEKREKEAEEEAKKEEGGGGW